MNNPEKDGWYMARYGNFIGEYLYTRGEWWTIGVDPVAGRVMFPCDQPDTWKAINEWQDEGE